MARSQRNQPKEKMSQKEKLKQKKDGEKMREQLKTVSWAMSSLWQENL